MNNSDDRSIYDQTEEIYAHLESYFDVKNYNDASIGSAMMCYLLDNFVGDPKNMPEFLDLFVRSANRWLEDQDVLDQ